MSEGVDYNVLTKARIYLRGEFAGRLEKLETGQYLFEYDAEWIAKGKGGIALLMPTQKVSYVSKTLFPFFDNLIPEGWLLSYAEQIYKIDKKNRFALLLATGRETIGAVHIIALDKQGKEIRREGIERDEELVKKFVKYEAIFSSNKGRCPYCLKELPGDAKQNFHPTCAKRMWGTSRKLTVALDKNEPLTSFKRTIYGASISGAQRKGLFNFEKISLTPTYKSAQFILKPQGDYPALPENEHITMSIARAVGFDVPPCTLFEITGLGKIFAIKRFDLTKDHQQLRLEDAAQVLEVPSDDKYKASYEKLGKMVEKFSDVPVIDKFEMWKRLLFSYFIGNGDMHLKNWSLLERDNLQGIFRLSPCYDFLNTRLPIPDEEVDLALTLNAKKHKHKLDDFLELAKYLKIEQSLVDEALAEIGKWWKTTQELLPLSFLSERDQQTYLVIVEKRFQTLRSQT